MTPARKRLRAEIVRVILGPRSTWNYGSFATRNLEDWRQYPEVDRAFAKADAILALVGL